VNRIKTGQDRCGHILHTWKNRDDPSYDCGETKQTIEHIVTECSKRLFSRDLTGIHNITTEAIKWTKSLDIDL